MVPVGTILSDAVTGMGFQNNIYEATTCWVHLKSWRGSESPISPEDGK